MSQNPENQQNMAQSEWAYQDEIKIIDLIYPLFKRRKFLLFFCIGIALLTGIISYFSQDVYESTAIILPKSDDSSSSISKGLASTFLEQFGITSLGGSSTTTSSVLFEAILKSNELSRGVLQRYDYIPMMGVNQSYENIVVRSFAGRIKVNKSTNDPSISITVQSNDPVFASDLANSYVMELNKYNLKNSFTSTRYLREYIEKRMDEAYLELDQAQSELREFQEKNSAISISKQGEETLKILGEMQAKVVTLEVEKNAKEKFYKGSHIQIEQLDAQMAALRNNIDQLTYSRDSEVPVEMEGGKIEFYIPLNSIPGLNFSESKLLLRVQAKTSVVTLLTTQLEQAKLNEARDIPTINVLQWASPPLMPSKPNTKLNVILSLVISLFLGVVIIFFIEFLGRIDQDPLTAPKWMEMKNSLMNLIKIINRCKR